MTKQELENLSSMLASKNLDDRSLAVGILLELPIELWRDVFHTARCIKRKGRPTKSSHDDFKAWVSGGLRRHMEFEKIPFDYITLQEAIDYDRTRTGESDKDNVVT